VTVATADLTGPDSQNTAYVFPGQGSQYVGMGKALYERSGAARRVFQQADEILGFKLSQLCFEGPAEELEDTINAQPAILTVSRFVSGSSRSATAGNRRASSPATASASTPRS